MWVITLELKCCLRNWDIRFREDGGWREVWKSAVREDWKLYISVIVSERYTVGYIKLADLFRSTEMEPESLTDGQSVGMKMTYFIEWFTKRVDLSSDVDFAAEWNWADCQMSKRLGWWWPAVSLWMCLKALVETGYFGLSYSLSCII